MLRKLFLSKNLSRINGKIILKLNSSRNLRPFSVSHQKLNANTSAHDADPFARFGALDLIPGKRFDKLYDTMTEEVRKSHNIKSDPDSVKAYKEAADHGDKEAQFKTSFCYEHGLGGLPVDLFEARRYADMASDGKFGQFFDKLKAGFIMAALFTRVFTYMFLFLLLYYLMKRYIFSEEEQKQEQKQ